MITSKELMQMDRVLEMAHVLFMDIVSYSLLPMDQQPEIVYELQELVRGLPEFRRAQSRDELICLPTGDGMALAFFGDPSGPVRCARQAATALRQGSKIALRMGIHTGPVYRVADVNENRNVAGGGINLAQRVMDCGDSGHILVSRATADILLQLTDWRDSVHDLGECEVKHGVVVHIFNLAGEGFGNPGKPAKLRRASPAAEPNLGRLVAKMCDRRAQEEEFRHTFMDALEECRGRPQLYFLCGEEGQCHESLVERLMHRVGLAAGGESEDQASGRSKKIPWQYEGDLAQRAARLIYSLFESFGPRSVLASRPKDLSPRAFAELLAGGLHAWIAVQHDVHVARWDAATPELIRRYAGFLKEKPEGGALPLLVFINVIFPRPETGLLNKLGGILASRNRKQIWQQLKSLEAGCGLPCRALAELPPVTREDVLEWFSLNGIHNSEEKRIRAVDRLFPPGSNLGRPMWEIETFCEQELRSFIEDRGFKADPALASSNR